MDNAAEIGSWWERKYYGHWTTLHKLIGAPTRQVEEKILIIQVLVTE